MNLESGKTYLTRCGDTVTTKPNNDLHYPWASTHNETLTWTNEGRVTSSFNGHHQDIMSEIGTSPQPQQNKNMNDIGYHTRLFSDNTRKIVGGSFKGDVNLETVNRLVNSQFTVIVKASGTPVFVDIAGREVRLYISVDAISTTKGAEAHKLWIIERDRLQVEKEKLFQEQEDELNTLMRGLTHEEIVNRLKNKDSV